MDIISVDASHPGTNHDSFIWSNHPLRSHLENLSSTEALWLLGDSGYPSRKTLMTPILNAQPESPEAYYTERHIETCNIIESPKYTKRSIRCLRSWVSPLPTIYVWLYKKCLYDFTQYL